MTASLVSLPPLMTADGRFVPDVDLTVRQTAALCGCTMQTVRRRQRAGRMPNARLIGGPGTAQWFIPVRDLVTAGLLAAEQVAPDGATPDLSAYSRQGHLQHLVEQNRRLAAQVTALTRDNAFLRSLVQGIGGAA